MIHLPTRWKQCLLLSLAAFLHAEQDPPLTLAVGVSDAGVLAPFDSTGLLVLTRTADERLQLRSKLKYASVGLLSDWSLEHWPPRLVDELIIGYVATCPPELAERLLADGGTLRLLQDEESTYENRPLLQPRGKLLYKQPTPDLDDWPMMRRDPGRSGYSRDRIAGPPQAPRWLAGGMYGEIPTLAAEGLLITRESLKHRSIKYRLRARSAFNGRLIWEQDVDLFDPEVIKGHPIGERGKLGGRGKLLGVFAHQDQLYVRGETELKSFDLKTGTPAVSFPLKDALWLTPNENGILVVGNESTRLIHSLSGSILWSIKGEYRRPLVANGQVVLLQRVGEEPGNSVILGRDIRTGKENWSRSLDDLRGVDLRSITSQGEVLVFGRIHPVEFSSKDRKKKNPLIRLRTLDLMTGSTLWSSEALQPTLNPIRMITEVDGTFYMTGAYRPQDGLKIDPRVKRFKVQSVNIGCQLAASTPNYLLFKDHGGTDLEGNHFASPGTFTLGKSVCGQQYIPAYGLSFITSQPCDCRGAGHWLRAGVPTERADPLLGKFSDPLSSIADEVGEFPVEKGSVNAEDILNAHPNPVPGWSHAYGDAERRSQNGEKLPETLTTQWVRKDLNPLPSSHPAFPSVSGAVTAGNTIFVSLVENGSVLALNRTTGEERWRWRGDSRIPSPPVVYRGLVLAGQQSGHVVALEASTGRMAWRTRVAPGVRVIADHGRISSMWPVNSPLTVVGKRVYGVAGLFFHWANTPRVFSIDLETGEVAWSQLSRINGRLLQATDKGLLTSRETAVGARWFGGIAVGHFDLESGAFRSLPRTGNSRPRTPAKSVVFRWRMGVTDKRKHRGYQYYNGDRIHYENGALYFYRDWKDREGKTAGIYIRETGSEHQRKLLPMKEGLVPLGIAGDDQGLVITTNNGSITALK